MAFIEETDGTSWLDAYCPALHLTLGQGRRVGGIGGGNGFLPVMAGGSEDEITLEAPETEITDESTNVTIIEAPDPEPPAPETVPQHDHGPCAEAARANTRIDQLEESMAAAAVAEEIVESQVEDAPTETVIESDPVSEETTTEAKASGHMAPGWF